MTAYPEFDKKALSDFSGRPEASYRGYADTALKQARLLFKIGTCLASLPDDPDLLELASNGILSMADNIYLAQEFQKAAASPFSSESIGSYSYSKAAKAVAAGLDTGIMWFDLARDQLGVCDSDDGVPTSGGIAMSMGDGNYHSYSNGSGVFLSPQDINSSRSYGYDPSGTGLY